MARLLRPFTFDFWRYKAMRALEVAQGLDFMRVVQADEVGLDPVLSIHSAPSGDRHLVRALKQLRIQPSDSVLDIGCGKGSAMRILLGFPFVRVDGNELSEHIAEIARSNFKRLRIAPQRCSIFTGDATALHEELDRYSHFYMYHPFRSPVMKIVAKNLAESLHRSPRPVTIVYRMPACHADLVASGDFELERSVDAGPGDQLNIYRSRMA
jgi:SAM-dependent methyltransferase